MIEDAARQALAETPADDPALDGLLAELKRRYGEQLDAVVLYGSYLRGAADALPDLYLLLRRYPPLPRRDRWLGSLLTPNVYLARAGEARAKVSVLRTRQLLKAVTWDLHPYYWARFAQPCRLLHCRDASVRRRLEYIVAQSTRRLLAAAGGGGPAASAAFWEALFARTYAAELRSERAAKRRELYAANPGHYDALFAARPAGGGLRPPWLVRQAIGKALSAARILKSALTLEDPIGYMLWKLERHSGIRLEATDRQRRHPFLFGWPLVWRLYRQGAFR